MIVNETEIFIICINPKRGSDLRKSVTYFVPILPIIRAPCSESMCFFCPVSILITLLGGEGTGLCAYRAVAC